MAHICICLNLNTKPANMRMPHIHRLSTGLKLIQGHVLEMVFTQRINHITFHFFTHWLIHG